MKFNGITKKGREYLAKIQSLNKPMNFSKIKIGDGLLDNYDNPAELIGLQNLKVEKEILELTQESDTVTLKTNIDNVDLITGYYPREIGVFVNDDGLELMYYYMNDGDETSWIPPESDGPFRIDLKINLIASNTASVIAPNSGKNLYITKEFLENNYTQKGTFTGTAGDLENRIIGLAGKQNGKFPLSSAIKGNVYLLEQTQKFYVCTSNYNGTTISVPNSNFTELSVYENMNRLENLFTINNLRYDSGNIENIIKGDWKNIATISENDKILSLTTFGSDKIRMYSHSFIINTLKYPNGIYFVTMSTANLGYTGGFIRVNGNTVQVKSTSNTSSHDYYVRNIRIYS